jgi:hypothetical protein
MVLSLRLFALFNALKLHFGQADIYPLSGYQDGLDRRQLKIPHLGDRDAGLRRAFF